MLSEGTENETVVYAILLKIYQPLAANGQRVKLNKLFITFSPLNIYISDVEKLQHLRRTIRIYVYLSSCLFIYNLSKYTYIIEYKKYL